MRDDLTHLPFLFCQNLPGVFGIKTQKILANSQFLYYYGHTSGRKWCKVVKDGCCVDEEGKICLPHAALVCHGMYSG